MLFDDGEWCVVGDRSVDEEVEDPAGGVEIAARGDQRLLRCGLGGKLGSRFVLVDQVDERLDEIVVDLAKSVIGEAQQVELDNLAGHALQLVDGVELDQRGVILHAFVGELSGQKKGPSKFVQRLKDLAARGLGSQRFVAEVLGLTLEFANEIHAVVSFQERCQLLLDGWRHCVLKQPGYPAPLAGHRATHDVLHERIARRDDALIFQVPQGVAQDCDRLRRKHRGPACPIFQVCLS